MGQSKHRRMISPRDDDPAASSLCYYLQRCVQGQAAIRFVIKSCQKLPDSQVIIGKFMKRDGNWEKRGMVPPGELLQD